MKNSSARIVVSKLKLLTLLSDPTRLRLLAVLRYHELSVAELQECLRVGQSRISMHLAQLKSVGLLQSRREGQRAYYRMAEDLPADFDPFLTVAFQAANELPRDKETLQLVLKKRREQTERYFNMLAGRLGKNYCPGRSWEAWGRLFLQLAPPLVIADLGAGEGLLSQLLAKGAKKVIAVDNSPKMVEVGKALAARNKLVNLEYRLGDMEEPPLAPSSVDVVIFSQALHHAVQPERALAAGHRILKTGGRLFALDLNQHRFEKARKLYADVWLGFAEADLRRMLQKAGFREIHVAAMAKETEAPFFQPILASARK
ncbi:MAG: metalloregulator ArsR/SmtB family transcription factor [bacterium]